MSILENSSSPFSSYSVKSNRLGTITPISDRAVKNLLSLISSKYSWHKALSGFIL